MEEQQYLFKDFDLFPDKKEGALFYSPEISAHLNNKNLIALLQEIKSTKMSQTANSTFNRLLEKYNLQDTTVKKYLSQELKILSALAPDRFENVFINSDDTVINDMLHEYFSGRDGIKLYSPLEENIINEKSLLFMFNSVYWPEDFDRVFLLAEKYQAWVLTAYIANHYLIIDNIYTPQKGMPCHFCNFNRHQNLVMSNNALKKTSWINYSRRALSEDLEAMPAMRLSVAERGMVVFWLAKVIHNYTNPHDMTMSVQDVSRYTWINLLTGDMNQEQAVHWFSCQCRSEGCL